MKQQTLPIYFRKGTLWFLPIIALFLFLCPTISQADEGSLNFYVTPELPASQVEDSHSYFDLNLEAGKTETLSLILQNASSEPIQVQVTPHTAYTNVHGVVEYGKDAEEPDPTLPYSLDELIEVPEMIELAGNETKTVELTLHMPKEVFDGFLAGGLRISEIQAEKAETPSEEEGVAIKNEFAYVIGVVVSNTRDSVQPDLDLLAVFADQLNYRNVISATIQNFMPTFVNRLEVEATVQKEGEDEILYEGYQEQMQMAPNSHFNFPISLEGDRFQSGNYTLNMTARSGDEEWTWTQNFTIEAEEARALNRADVSIDTSLNWWMIGTISLLALIILMAIYFFWKKKKEVSKVDGKE